MERQFHKAESKPHRHNDSFKLLCTMLWLVEVLSSYTQHSAPGVNPHINYGLLMVYQCLFTNLTECANNEGSVYVKWLGVQGEYFFLLLSFPVDPKMLSIINSIKHIFSKSKPSVSECLSMKLRWLRNL